MGTQQATSEEVIGRRIGRDGAWAAFCRRALTLLACAATLVVAFGTSGCSTIGARQREAIYRPTPGIPPGFAGLRPGDQAYTLTFRSNLPERLIGGQWLPGGAPQNLHLWWLPQPDPKAPALLYLHGTFRNLYQNLPKIEALREAGFAVLAVDYRGWGLSTALSPSEDSINADARRAWAEFERHVPDARRRVIYGHSMGGGVAVALAAQLRYPRDYAALVLESTFTSLPDVASSAGWLGRIGAMVTTERFDSLDRIEAINAPLLMLHGEADRTVPFELGQRLFAAARMPDKSFVAIAGGSHSGLQSDAPETYQRAMRALVARLSR